MSLLCVHTCTQTIAKFQIVLVSETNKEDTYLLMLYDKVNNMDNVVAGFTGGTLCIYIIIYIIFSDCNCHVHVHSMWYPCGDAF